MLRTGFSTKNLLSAAFAVAIILLPARTVLADTLDYTFSGVASGTIAGNTNATFSNADFTISFTEDTTALYNSSNSSLGAGYYAYAGIDGTFTEGAYTTTFTDDILEVNGNGNTGSGAYETVLLLNSDAGSSLVLGEDPVLLGYALATPITTGTVSSNLGAYQDAEGFTTTTGDTVEFTGVNSLDFTAADTSPSPVPEPSTLVLLTSGLLGVGLLRHRFSF